MIEFPFPFIKILSGCVDDIIQALEEARKSGFRAFQTGLAPALKIMYT